MAAHHGHLYPGDPPCPQPPSSSRGASLKGGITASSPCSQKPQAELGSRKPKMPQAHPRGRPQQASAGLGRFPPSHPNPAPAAGTDGRSLGSTGWALPRGLCGREAPGGSVSDFIFSCRACICSWGKGGGKKAGEQGRGEHRTSSGFFSPVSRPGSSILEGREGGRYHAGQGGGLPPEQGLDCCVCCPLPILGPGQAAHGARPHSGQGQGTRLSHRGPFGPYTRVCCMCGCVCECGRTVSVRPWAVPVCARRAACLGLRGCVCTSVHTCATYMYPCTCVRVPWFGCPQKPTERQGFNCR